jgi:hypothetical protein
LLCSPLLCRATGRSFIPSLRRSINPAAAPAADRAPSRAPAGPKQFLAVQTSGRHLHPIKYDNLGDSSYLFVFAELMAVPGCIGIPGDVGFAPRADVTLPNVGGPSGAIEFW